MLATWQTNCDNRSFVFYLILKFSLPYCSDIGRKGFLCLILQNDSICICFAYT